MSTVSHTLKEKLKRIQSKEKGTIRKNFTDKTSCALVYPNLYQVGMSNLGFQKIYSVLNQDEGQICERVFLPDKNDIQLFFKHNIPLFSFESQTPVEQFDIIAFSLSFELDYINILTICELSHIPFLKKDRTEGDPLLIAGGICPTFNPEPLADFFDLIIIGEGEGVLSSLVTDYTKNRSTGQSKEEFLIQAAALPGVYIPSGYEVIYHPSGTITSIVPLKGFPSLVKKLSLDCLDLSPASTCVFTSDTIFSDTFLLEIERGCPMKCHFCVSGNLSHSRRYLSLEMIQKKITEAMQYTRHVGIIGLSAAHYPEWDALCKFCIANEISVSISSLRIDAITESLLSLLERSGNKTITFAPETGTERLRQLVNKKISDAQIIDAVNLSLRYNFSNIKLYFIVGLPGEKDIDLEGIVTLVKSIKQCMLKSAKEKKRIGTITLSINPYIPKPHTPFQYERMEEVKVLLKKIKNIALGLKNEGNIKITSESPRLSLIQGILSMGDRRVSDLLVETYRQKGDYFAAIRALSFNPGFYLYRKKNIRELLPWGHIKI